ncbi:hypothetical protein C6B38_00400 [Spiroplasma sp. ChiS]|uniref:pentapeptide repeat-containing protein n=1 Tax=Spiroplasma sp. ChiS TaxID=2099885 RepID=UPI000CF8CF78|nr:pentapeptide repeat-containing protein [Spiroplasma sp. ChiS]PQP79708.1 hypothetical protein C6B38_00400 [Spiroplasma sp. ChiS]
MKKLQDLIKDLTDITVEQNKINDYLENEVLNLIGVNLQDASLRCADLRCANLSEADLSGADLRFANLQGIKITKEQLEQLIVIDEDK